MIDERPQILVELGTELDRAAARTFSTTCAVHTRRDFPRRRSAVSLAAIAGAGVIALILIVSGHRQFTGSARSMPSGARALDTAFVVLRRPVEPSDGLPSSELHFLQRYARAFRIFSLEPAHSRRVVTTANVMVWLVPGPREACLVGTERKPITEGNHGAGFSVGCDTAGTAERHGMISMFGDTVAGVLPNHSTHVRAVGRDGSTTDLELRDGAFALRFRLLDLPLTVDYIDPAGARDHFEVSSPARASHWPSESVARRESP